MIHIVDVLKKIPINTSMKEFFKSAGLLLGCILLSRFILPANITPLIAMAVFMPYLTSNKQLQMFLPVSIMFITDIFLGFYSTMWLTYGIMALIGVVSRVLNNGQYSTLMGSSVLSVVLWHLIINIPGPFPPLSPEALVFDLRLLGSTIVFVSMFYAIQRAVTPALAEVIYINTNQEKKNVRRF